MTDYSLFLGCMIPLRLPALESTTRILLNKFGIDTKDLADAGCCPDPSLKSLDKETWTTLAARNLALAEEKKRDVLTLCNGCFETLKSVNETLKKDAKLRENINGRLSTVGREYQGIIDVKHLVEVLANDIGVQRIKEGVTSPLSSLKVAVHYGCHLLRPGSILNVDHPLRPNILDQLVEATGAESVPYYKKNLCCGAEVSGFDSDTSKRLVKYKLDNVRRSKADCIVVVCPFCMLQYDVTQRLVKDDDGESYEIPVLYYPELLLLAMEAGQEELHLEMHRTKVDPLIERIEEAS
jgi:heterodisulfide reductase subunit B